MDNSKTYLSIPIYIIGAGGIVNTAHLPAYRAAGYNVQGIFDTNQVKAAATAQKFSIPRVYHSLQEMLNALSGPAVLDVAVPGHAIIGILQDLPEHTSVLLQKPMGEDLPAARKILSLVQEKHLLAAVNFQLRYAPFIKQAKKMIGEGLLGEINDIEINVNVFTPWELWDFLFTAPRLEILYHSIHYIDLVRSFFGNPLSVYAKTTRHPATPQLAGVRSNIIMDYGTWKRANILSNHRHDYPGSQQSFIKIEGSRGAIKIEFGTLKNYPVGEPDHFYYTLMEEGKYTDWQEMPVNGSWFPEAFAGSMEQVLLAAQGIITRPDNSVEDAIHTMECVEAAYISSERGGIRPDQL